MRVLLSYTNKRDELVRKKKSSPANRSRTSDLKITVVLHLQSSALPTELSRAHQNCQVNATPHSETSSRDLTVRVLLSYTNKRDEVGQKKASPANRSRTSDLKITVVSHLQSSALPTELSRAHQKCQVNTIPHGETSGRDLTVRVLLSYTNKRDELVRKKKSSPANRSRTSDLKITVVLHLQSSALPTELSRAHQNCQVNATPHSETSSRDLTVRVLLSYTNKRDELVRKKKSSPANRSRTSDLKITVVLHLQSSALPTELSRAHQKCQVNTIPHGETSGRDLTVRVLLSYTNKRDELVRKKKSSPANRSRTSDLKITVVSHLQSSALPTELSRAHQKCQVNAIPRGETSSRDLTVRVLLSYTNKRDKVVQKRRVPRTGVEPVT